MTNYHDCKKFCVEIIKRRLRDELSCKIQEVPWFVSDIFAFQANGNLIIVEPQIAEKIGIEDAPCYLLDIGVCDLIETLMPLDTEKVWIYFVDANEGKFFESCFENLEKTTLITGRNFPPGVSSAERNLTKRAWAWHKQQFKTVEALHDDDLAELRKFYDPKELGLPTLKTTDKELDRLVCCAIDTFQTEVDFLRNRQSKIHGDDDLEFADILEAATNIIRQLHEDWRAHLGYPIIDTNTIIADLLNDLAADVRSGSILSKE